MSCTDNVCGTGGWSGPAPGDPEGNVTISARTVYGGINVSWSWPVLNGHAVAHTKVYRSTSSNFETAIHLGNVGSSIYFDSLDPTTETIYYYWIQIVTVNGTIQDRVGPASATAKVRGEQTLESLTGMIDAGVLANALKTEIAGITLNNAAIIKEIQDRISSNQALQTALAAVSGDLGVAMTYILDEIKARKDADSAQVTQTQVIAAGLNDANSAIVNERNVRIEKDEAMASDIETLVSTVGDASSGIVHELSTLTTRYNTTAQSVTSLISTVGDANSGLVQKVNTTASQSQATANSVTTLVSTVGNSNSGLVKQVNTLATTTSALASDVTTVEAAINGNVATGQVGLTAKVDSVTGAMESMYTAKLSVNGLIGGFGLYNDGNYVQAGFDVDTFWVGRTSSDKVKPFIVSNGIVYIDRARIRNADIDTLKIAGESVITGVYAEGGGRSIIAGGSATLITRSIDLQDGNNSGLVVSATVSCDSSAAASVGFRIRINGSVVSDQGASIQPGYAYLFPVSGFGEGGNGSVTIALEAYSNPSPSPEAFSVTKSSMSVMGGKR